MDASYLGPVATLYKKLDRDTVLKQRRAPLARPYGDQQLASQFGR